MEEQENDWIVFDRFMKIMRKAIHLDKIQCIYLSLTTVAFFIPGSLEDGICDEAYIPVLRHNLRAVGSLRLKGK